MKKIQQGLLMLACLCGMQASADVRDTPTERALSLPAGAPALVLKRGDWTIAREQRRPGDTAVYYLLNSEGTKTVFSVYIDKSTACQSADACLKQALTNKGYAGAKEMQTFDAGPFKVAQFYIDNPGGAPVVQANILAAAYVDGHWFDVHISKVDKERPDAAALAELIKSVSIR